MNKVEALYIHIPFCDNICSYCDFYKMITTNKIIQEYLDCLLLELFQKKKLFNDIKTIYIGGGTPSVLSNEQLNLLLMTLNSLIDFSKVKEFTIEANPNHITQKFIDIIKKNNVSRLSLGIQSFSDEKLILMNRRHNKEIALKSLQLLKLNNFENLNVDLIFGFPLDNIDLIKNDLDILIESQIPHISCYSLIMEDKTILNHLEKQGKFFPLSENKEIEIYNFIQDYLIKNKFHQYEISNFSFLGYQSLHNLTYWNNENYLGIGAGASYYIDNIRYCVVKNIKRYCQSVLTSIPCYFEVNVLTLADQMFEEIMLGLRKSQGINTKVFLKKFGYNIYDIYPVIDSLLKAKLLEKKNEFLYIPLNKLYISNAIILKFI